MYDPTFNSEAPQIMADYGYANMMEMKMAQLPKSKTSTNNMLNFIIQSLNQSPEFDKNMKMENLFRSFKAMVKLICFKIPPEAASLTPSVSESIDILTNNGFLDPSLPLPHLTKQGLTLRNTLIEVGMAGMIFLLLLKNI